MSIWQTRHEFEQRVLLGRTCPECGGNLLYYEYDVPLHNPVKYVPDRSAPNAVLFGRWWCKSYGQCEMAPG